MNDKIKKRVLEWFKENPNPSDDQVHDLAESLKIDPHEFETVIYSLLTDFVGAERVVAMDPRTEYQKLSKLSVTALQGMWRRMDIGPSSDRPKDQEGLIDDIMAVQFGDDWQRKAFAMNIKRQVVATLIKAGRRDLARKYAGAGMIGKFKHQDIETKQDAMFVMDGLAMALSRLGFKTQAHHMRQLNKGMQAAQPVASVTAAAVQVETREYRLSHMREPKGRGGWIFAFGNDPDDQSSWHNFNGTYQEARKAAVKQAREQGVSLIHVMP